MKYKLTLEIEFESGEAARRMYADFVGLNERELSPGRELSFSGKAIPNLFTLMRPAYVTIDPVREKPAVWKKVEK